MMWVSAGQMVLYLGLSQNVRRPIADGIAERQFLNCHNFSVN